MKIMVRDAQRMQQPIRLTHAATVDALPSPGGDVPLTGDVQAKADVYAADGEFLVALEVSAQADIACSRCLGPIELPLQVRFSEVFRPGSDNDDSETAPSERHVTYYSGDEIDLLPIVVENLALALPMKPLCREDCQGLCPSCGQNRNDTTCECDDEKIDPRLAKLGELWQQARSARKGVE